MMAGPRQPGVSAPVRRVVGVEEGPNRVMLSS